MSTALAMTRRLPLLSLLLGGQHAAPSPARPAAVPIDDGYGLGGSVRITW